MSSCDSNVITMSDQLTPGDSLTEGEVTVELYARAELPTQFGDFHDFRLSFQPRQQRDRCDVAR